VVFLNPLIKGLMNERDYTRLFQRIRKKGMWPFDPFAVLEKAKITVLNSYREELERRRKGKGVAGLPIIDSRCPAIRDYLIDKEFPHLTKLTAPIHPILITGAIIVRQSFGYLCPEIIVVSPCRAFKDYCLKGVKIRTWVEFREMLGFFPSQKKLEQTPIPLGFFKDLGAKIYGASGEENCRRLLAEMPSDAALLELLWCEGGCHKGDGLY
jgi:hypothetical protein